MDSIKIIAQIFSMVAFCFGVYSFQEKNNNRFFLEQGIASAMFGVSYLLLGATAAALSCAISVLRSVLFMKNRHKKWKLILVEIGFVVMYAVTLAPLMEEPLRLVLTILTGLELLVMTYVMWRGNGTHIRYVQLYLQSPLWLVYNIAYFSIGGIFSELFSMASVIIAFIRHGRNGFEKK